MRNHLLVLPLAAVVAAGTLPALPASAQDAAVRVVVNGQTVPFDQPPIERAGRVFVPLRGVFERLGAEVVFQNGQINATRGGTTVSLQIGSTAAVVNGRQQLLDVAPFLVGARTLVPLRFVSQALGATVTFDDGTNTVTVTRPLAAAPRPPARIELVHFEPGEGRTVNERRPQIGATFDRHVDPNTVRVTLDGRDVTAGAYVSDRGFNFTPGFDLPYGRHEVRIAAGGAGVVNRSWTFTDAPAPQPNFIDRLAPNDGAAVGTTFAVEGRTRPGSRVHIVAVADAAIGFRDVIEGESTGDVVANDDGFFRVPIAVRDRGAGIVDVRVQATAPNGGVSVRTIRLRPTRRDRADR
jgi:hypothetical protein